MDSNPELAILNSVINELAKELSVLAVELGGSRGLGLAEAGSDFDLIVYFQRDRPVDSALILRRLKDVMTDHIPSPSGHRIIARVGKTKLEFFYRDIAVLERQVQEIQEGAVKLNPDRWVPQSKLTIEFLSLLTHCKVLYDPYGKLDSIKRAVTPMPAAYRDKLLKFARDGAGTALRNMRKARRAPDHYNYIMGHIFLFFWYVEVGIFALNGLYPFWNKQTSAYVSKLRRAPKDYLNRVSNIYRSAISLEAPQAYADMSSLLKELQEA
jgi:hypothetical protein